jgi:hypothetical protein
LKARLAARGDAVVLTVGEPFDANLRRVRNGKSRGVDRSIG